jgi:hypothetical protein
MADFSERQRLRFFHSLLGLRQSSSGTDHSQKGWAAISAAGEELQLSGRKMTFAGRHDKR